MAGSDTFKLNKTGESLIPELIHLMKIFLFWLKCILTALILNAALKGNYCRFPSFLLTDYQTSARLSCWALKSNAMYSHCKVFQARYHPSGVIILTLFFWQVSQRDHALQSDKTQSTGWTTTRPPTERASRTPGSSLLAAVMATSLWHEDQIKTKAYF